MAENILGLLFVTSSSRGRNVFRYPPDPFSPLTRLSQPYYPQSTYTAKDVLVKHDRKQLFPPGYHDRSTKNPSDKSGDKLVREWALGGSEPTGGETAFTLRTGYTSPEESDGGSVSSDEEMGSYKAPQQQRAKRQSSGEHRINGHSYSSHAQAVLGAQYDGARRGSLALADITIAEKQAKQTAQDEYFVRQYDSALAYSLDFLGDMLTPPRSACNRKFEVCVDELMFVGHPVTNGPDGKWTFPDEDADLRPSARGRRRTDEKSGLGTVVEGKEMTSSPDPPAESAKSEQAIKMEDNSAPSLNMFHLVFILDRPDPKGTGLDQDESASNLADEVYREIAFKWTAAAFALQVKENWVAKNAWEITRLKEKCYNEGVPIMECCRIVYERNPLDRALNQLFTAIHNLRTKPANPLYSYLPTTLTVNLVDIPITMVLSPRSNISDEHWAHWGELDEQSSVDDSDSESGMFESRKTADLRIEPWQALLLIEDDAADKAEEISRTLIGLGVDSRSVDDESTPSGSSRRGSKDVTTAEEDEGLLMESLIRECRVTKRLSEIAHDLRYDLEGIVIPLARELVQNKKAILINPMTSRLRVVVMPTTIVEHTAGLDDYAARYARAFPDLPSLRTLIASISASPCQFKDTLPSGVVGESSRQRYLDALVWLIKQDLVVQVHTRARIYARPEIKETAWRKLWHRRRARWLRRITKQTKTPLMSPVDLTTPRASLHDNPLENTVSSPRKGSGDLSDFEVDSDVNEDDEDDDTPDRHNMGFRMEELEPKEIPKFQGSFIFHPARAQKDETRWLRVIREQADEVWASKFDLCVQYFDGVATFEEISYRTGMKRRELDRVLQLYPDDLVTFLHP